MIDDLRVHPREYLSAAAFRPRVIAALPHFPRSGEKAALEILLAARETGPARDFGKFQGELVNWRELSFNFVQWNRGHRTVEAIPGWAREELRRARPCPARRSTPRRSRSSGDTA